MSQTVSSPTKRKRVEDESNVIRSTAIWLDDGNIILQAEKRQFRVHRSFLGNYSKAFRDMLAVPQPEGELTIDGCCVVHMPDKSADWEHVLSVIYHGVKLYPSIEDYPVPVLISMLRLGKKYQFDELVAVSVRRLEAELPITIQEWEKSHISDALYIINDKGSHFSKGHEIDLINVALEVGFQTILPVLYYLCVRDISLEAVFDGTTDSAPNGTTCPTSHLTHKTQRILVLGRDKLLHGVMKHPLAYLKFPLQAGCVGKPDCKDLCSEYLDTIADTLHTDVFLALQDANEDNVLSIYCKHCSSVYGRAFSNGRRRLWGELPLYFGLPPWEDLKDSILSST